MSHYEIIYYFILCLIVAWVLVRNWREINGKSSRRALQHPPAKSRKGFS